MNAAAKTLKQKQTTNATATTTVVCGTRSVGLPQIYDFSILVETYQNYEQMRVCLFVDSFVTTILGVAAIATYLYLPRFQFTMSVENCIHIEQVGAVCTANTVKLLRYKKSDCQKHVKQFANNL